MLRWTATCLSLMLFFSAAAQPLEVMSPVMVTHASNPVTAITLNQARSMFSMRLKQWPDGRPVTVFVLADDHLTHRKFVQSFLGMFPHQLRRNWDRYVYTGTGQAPIEVHSEADMIRRLQKRPNAIGYSAMPLENTQLRPLTLHSKAR